jgi:sulfur carrier protein
MRVCVNGVEREVSDGTTVAGLLEKLSVQQPGVAVAVNRAVVPQTHHGSARLSPADQVEIIQAVGGG